MAAPIREDDPTIGRLLKDASTDISTLINKEIQLAKSELTVSVKNGTTGAGFFGAAAFLLLLGVVILSIAIGYFLVWAGLGPHWAFLIVAGAYFLVAAVLGFLGYRKVMKVRPPKRAIEQAKEMPAAFKR